MRARIASYVDPRQDAQDLIINLRAVLDSGGVRQTTSRAPMHVGLVLDKSSSMHGEKIALLRDAASYFVQWLRKLDFLCVVSYDSSVTVTLPFSELTNKPAAIAVIQEIRPGSSTNLSGGWITAMAELRNKRQSQALAAVVLFTDGQANQGITDPDRLCEVAKQFHSQGIRTSTMALGRDADAALLAAIAREGSGNAYVIEKPEDIASAFRKEFADLSEILFTNTTLEFTAPPGTIVQDVLAEQPVEATETGFRLRFGDFGSEDERRVFWQLRVPISDGIPPTGCLSFEYVELFGNMRSIKESIELSQVLPATTQTEVDALRGEFWLARSAQLTEEARRLIASGSPETAKNLLTAHAAEANTLHQNESAVRAEQRRLLDLARTAEDPLGQLLQGDARGPGKRRSANPDRIIAAAIPAAKPEERAEFESKCLEALAEEGFTGPDTALILSELLSNALTHGCRNRQDATVEASVRIRSRCVHICVKDPGSGFDFSSWHGDQIPLKAQTAPGGNGLRMVKAAALRLSFAENGSRVEAVVLKQKMDLDAFVLQTRDDCFFADDVVCVRIQGSIDYSNGDQIRQKVLFLMNHSINRIVLDMTRVTFMDSSGIGILLKIAADLDQTPDGGLAVAALNQSMSRVMTLAGLDRCFPIFDTVETALQHFRA